MGVGITISSKTVVGLLSVLFLAAAIGMWFMGGYVIATYKRIDTLASAYYTLVPAAVMIAIGIIFVLGAISGFCAACRESRACSLTFFVFVFLIFALLITAIALSFVYKREINKIVERESDVAMKKYGQPKQNSTTDQIDYLHRNFKCCGSFNYTSWNSTPFGLEHPDHVPLTCCRKDFNESQCLDGDLSQMKDKADVYIYTAGCVGEVEHFMKQNLYYLGAGAIAFLVLLILGMVGSCIVLWQRKETSYFNLGS
jgi:tetraspanin-3